LADPHTQKFYYSKVALVGEKSSYYGT